MEHQQKGTFWMTLMWMVEKSNDQQPNHNCFLASLVYDQNQNNNGLLTSVVTSSNTMI